MIPNGQFSPARKHCWEERWKVFLFLKFNKFFFHLEACKKVFASVGVHVLLALELHRKPDAADRRHLSLKARDSCSINDFHEESARLFPPVQREFEVTLVELALKVGQRFHQHASRLVGVKSDLYLFILKKEKVEEQR
jgi:hypothetical protein